MLRVLFVIRSLDAGGTERQVVELLRGLEPTRVHPTLLTFYSGGELEDEVRALPHVVLASLGKRGRWDLVSWMPALRRILRAARPDVVHGYLGFPNLLALVAGRLTGTAVVWGLRSSFMDLTRYDRLARVEFSLARVCSRFADALVVNSDRGRQYLTAQGFAADRLVTIRNGIDVSRFRPDPAGRVRVREAWESPTALRWSVSWHGWTP
jgi:glycosyltransferase involved in cell wall biosynthesis